jgi:carboxyl-terminal processing protease
MRKIKIVIVHLLVLVFVVISPAANTSRDIYKQVRKNQSLINDVYRHIITNYVDDIDLDAFTKMSINNMLLELDPYTTYMEKEEKDGIEMLTRGKYGGVGIQIGLREKQLTVISPMDQSPAKRAGILSGDKIIKIDGEQTADFNIDDAAKLIRGKKGTEVVLSIQRYGEVELIDFVLMRETIPVKDISYSGMLNESTGYIRLTRFSRNSDKEMKSAIETLLENKMSDLILDLRDNPGGLLNSAVSILDFFIEKGETLVWTEGKSQKLNRRYTSKTDPILPPDINIAVLVNQGSASASEIIAGALQDLDRGIVIGRPTFGKGLVQTVFNIDRERAIKVTTAKYYIPSGRLIQKPGYLPDEILADTVEQDTIFQTKGGRTVSGSGGITPDHEVEPDEITPLLSVSWRQGLFFNFIQKNKMNYSSIDEVEKDTSLIYSFEDYLHSNDLDIFMKGERNYLDMKDMLFELDSTSVQIQGALDILDSYFEQIAFNQFDKEKQKLNHYLLVEFADFFNGEEGRIKISSRKDKDIQKALSILNDPVAYERIFLPQ